MAPIRMFAVFLGMMTIFDYIFVVIICAPALVLQMRWIEATRAKGPHMGRYIKLSLLDFSQCSRARKGKEKKETIAQFILVSVAKGTTALRYVLVPGLLAIFAYFTLVALDIPMPESSEVQLFPDNHVFTKWAKWRNDLYVREGAETSWVRVIFGLVPGDTGNINDPTSKSKVILDENFDLTEPEVQMWMLSFCEDIKQQNFTTGRADCTIKEFEDWLKRQYNPSTQSYGTSLPLPSAEFQSWLLQWRSSGGLHRQKNVGLRSEVEQAQGGTQWNEGDQDEIEYFVLNFEAMVKVSQRGETLACTQMQIHTNRERGAFDSC